MELAAMTVKNAEKALRFELEFLYLHDEHI